MEKKSTLLKVTGILMIIFGGLATIFAIIAVLGALVIEAAAVEMGLDPATLVAGLIMLGAVTALVGAAIQLVAGILGVKNHKKPEKAGVCVVFGILVALVTIASSIFEVSGGLAFDALNIVTLLIGLVIPVLYIIGALQLKKMA
jgi:hypothetical protein